MTELTTDYMDGALAPRKSLSVRLHLAVCSFCRRHFRQMRQTVGLLGEMPPGPRPAAVEDLILARVASGAARPSSPLTPPPTQPG